MKKELILDYDDFQVIKEAKNEKVYFYLIKRNIISAKLEPIAKVISSIVNVEYFDEDDLIEGELKLDNGITILLDNYDVTGEQVTDDEIIYWYFKIVEMNEGE